MARGKRNGVLIAGGGLAGSLAAIAMAKLRPDVPLLLVEASDQFGGEGILSFLEPELDEEQRGLVAPLIFQHAPACYVAFPGYSRKLKIGHDSIRAADLDGLVRETLRPDQYRLNTKVVAARETELLLPGGEAIRADGVIDARGAANLSVLRLGWRRIVARQYRFGRPHRVDLPVLADGTVEQVDGLRFFRCVPLSEDRLLVESHCLADQPDPDSEDTGAAIDGYVAARGWKEGVVEDEQAVVLPLPLGGDVEALWRVGGARVARLGVRGGFFHPATGSALADAARTALMLAAQKDFGGAALRDLFEGEAVRLWKRGEVHRSFNAALFDGPVQERLRMMAELYRADTRTISRFHRLELGVLGRMKIASLRKSAPVR